MKFQRKTPILLVTGAVLAASGMAFATVPANAGSGSQADEVARGKNNDPLVIRLKSSDNKTVASRRHFRPGVTEFHVTKTAKKQSSIAILESKNLQRSFTLLGKAFQGQAGSADAMAKFDKITTLYSGTRAEGRWQVKLSKGQYYAVDTSTNNITRFKVSGERRQPH